MDFGAQSLVSAPQKEGNLLKAGKAWPHKWHKRYLILRGNELLYYRSSKDTTPLGRMTLQTANVTLGVKDTHFNVELLSEEEQQNHAASHDTFKFPEKPSNQHSSHLQPLEQPKHVSLMWKLKAASKQDRQQWVEALDKAIIFAKLNESNQNLLHSPVQALNAAAPFDSDSQYKKVQQSYLRRLSLPPQGIEALSSLGELVAKPNSPLPPPQPPQPVQDKKEGAFKRLSRMFFAPKEEKQKEQAQPSLVELYFREQDQIEDIRRKSLSQSKHAVAANVQGDIADFSELQKLINAADEQKNKNQDQQQQQQQHQIASSSNSSLKLVAPPSPTLKGISGLPIPKRSQSIDNDATEFDANSDEEGDGTPTGIVIEKPANERPRSGSGSKRLKHTQALKQYKEDKQSQIASADQQQQQQQLHLGAPKHKRSNSDESERSDVLTSNASSASEGEASAKSDAEVSNITLAAAPKGGSKRNTIYYQPNMLHDPLQEIKQQKQKVKQEAAEGNNDAAKPEKKERRKSLLFSLFGRK